MGPTPERDRRPASRLPLTWVEWLCLAIAVVVAHAFLVHEWLYPSAWDATQYLNMGREIAARGLFSRIEGYEMRTYGYPFLVSVVLRASTWSGMSFVALLFAVQFLAYLAAVAFLRTALAPASPAAARIAFCGLLVNYYVLAYAPESLTESVSITLVVVTAGAWVVAWHRGLALWPVVLASLAVGIALMIRPANISLAVAWIIGVAVLCWRQRPPAGRGMLWVGILVLGMVLPMAPQVRNNVVYFGKATPLVTADIGHLHRVLGIRYLKYATALPPVSQAPIPYENPLVADTALSETAPLQWYVEYPLRGAATVALHTFNLTDQDLLFTYSRDLWPWYRVPLGAVNHAVVALGMLGLILLGRRAPTVRDPQIRDAFVVVLTLLAANWAVYAWTAVEMRFGAVLLLLLFPLAGYAVSRIAATRSFRTLAAATAGVALYVTLALILSDWVRDQAPAIRQARSASAGSAMDRAGSWGGG